MNESPVMRDVEDEVDEGSMMEVVKLKKEGTEVNRQQRNPLRARSLGDRALVFTENARCQDLTPMTYSKIERVKSLRCYDVSTSND